MGELSCRGNELIHRCGIPCPVCPGGGNVAVQAMQQQQELQALIFSRGREAAALCLLSCSGCSWETSGFGLWAASWIPLWFRPVIHKKPENWSIYCHVSFLIHTAINKCKLMTFLLFWTKFWRVPIRKNLPVTKIIICILKMTKQCPWKPIKTDTTVMVKPKKSMLKCSAKCNSQYQTTQLQCYKREHRNSELRAAYCP